MGRVGGKTSWKNDHGLDQAKIRVSTFILLRRWEPAERILTEKLSDQVFCILRRITLAAICSHTNKERWGGLGDYLKVH